MWKPLLRLSIATAMCAPALSFAALGGTAATLEAEHLQMKAQVHALRTEAKYTVHEVQLPSTTVVREYVDSEGKVFAVAWQGPALPDLSQVLGEYAKDFKQAASQPHGGRAQLHSSTSRVVIHSMGHMRAFNGVAYLPGGMPAGVNASELK